MTTIGYAQLPVPAGGDAPVGPGAIAALATAVDPHLVHHVDDLAHRDAALSGAPARTMAVALDGSTWIKTSSTGNTWITVWEPLSAWRPISVASGYEAGQTTPQVRVVGRQVHLRGRLQKTDGSMIAGGGVAVGTVPSDCYPQQLASFAGGASLTGDAMTGVGRVEIYSADQTSHDVGNVIWYSQDGDGVTWIDISGSYWLD